MGILDSIIDSIGGPKTVCKAMYKIYLREIQKGKSKQYARLHCLYSRYSILKTIQSPELEVIATSCQDLSDMCVICIIKENPYRGSPYKIVDTYLQVLTFFIENDSAECAGVLNIFNSLYNKEIQQNNDAENSQQCDTANNTDNVEDDTIIISCPECLQKLRVPASKNLSVKCKKCNCVFNVYKNGIVSF